METEKKKSLVVKHLSTSGKSNETLICNNLFEFVFVVSNDLYERLSDDKTTNLYKIAINQNKCTDNYVINRFYQISVNQYSHKYY